jgi:tetratricopeptide (TPR) repeat protein
MIQIAIGNLSSAQKQHKAYSAQRTNCNSLEPAFRKASNTLGNVLYKRLAPHETIEDHHRTIQLYKEHLAARERHHEASQELGKRAENGFRLALLETAKLTPAKSTAIDLQEIRLNLAFAYEVREKLERAESLFRALADSGMQGAADTALMLRACQALAALYLRQKRVDEADGFCRRAWLGRRRIFGKEHATYRESMLLNIEICRAKGQVVVADAYMAALPPDPKVEEVKEERWSSRSRGRY